MAITTTGVRYDLIARDSASRVFRGVGDSAGRLEGGLGRLAKTAAYAGAALAGGLAAGLAVSAERAVKFEASMKKIQTQAGATAGDVKLLSKQVLDLGKTTQQGPEALSEALYHLKSVGMDNVDAMKALKTSSDLAAVGGANLEDTANALAGAWRTGIKGATDFGQAASTVNAIIGAGNMSMQDMVAALGTGILPTAKTFGLTFSQVGAALALFTDEGVDSASAATRLRMSISLLAAPSGAAEKQLKKIGLTGNALGEAMRKPDGLIGAMKLLKQHLDASGLSATKQAALLSHAFGGGKSSSAILSMINNLDVLEKKQAQVNSSMGKYGPAVEAQRKTAAAQLAILKSNLDVFAIKTGNVLLPPLTKFVTYINSTVLPEVGKVGRALIGMVPVGAIEKDFGTIEGLVSDFAKGFETAPKKTVHIPTPTLKVPHTAIPDALRRPLEIPSPTLHVATTKIPAGLAAPVAAKSQAQKMGEQLRGLISGGIGDAVGKIDWGKTGKGIADGLGKAIGWIGTHSTDLTHRLAKAVGGIDWVDVGKSLGTLMLPLVIGMTDNMMAPLFTGTFWKKHWLDAILAAISVLPITRVFGKVGELFGKIPWGKLGEVLDHLPWGRIFRWADWITNPIGGALRAAGGFVARLGTGFTDAFSRQFPRVAQFFSDQLLLLPVRLGDLGRLLKNKAGGLLTGWGTKLVESIPGWGNKFIRGILKIFGRYTFWQTGVQLVEGLLSGVGNAMTGIGHWIMSTIVNPFVNWTKSLFGIHSPSTVFAGIGGWLIAGLKAGITGGIAGIGKWLYSTVISPITGAFAGAGGWLYGRGSALVSGLRSGASAGMSGIGKWVTVHIRSPFTSTFSKAGGWLSSAGGSLISGLKSGMVGALKGISGWLKSALVDPIVSAVKHWFGIKSPSRVFAGIGGHLVSGLVKGLATSNGLDIARRVFGDLPTALAAIVGKGLVHIEKLPAKALSALQGLGGKAASLLGSAGSSFFGGGTTAHMSDAMSIGRNMLLARGFQASEWNALRQLWTNESGWRVNAENASSGAYGIPQALPASKMASAGSDWRTNPATQIAWGLDYIKARYGTPSFALASWNSRSPHWYAKGGLAQFGETAWVGEQGPELMQVTPRGTRIYNNRDSMAIAGAAGMQIPGYASGTVASSRVSAAQRKVNAAQASLDSWRHREAAAHSKAARHADALQVEAAEKRLKAANAELAAAKRMATGYTSVANTLQNGFLKTLETGTAAGIASAIKSINSKLQNAGLGGMVPGNLRTSSKLQSLATQKASIANQIAAAKQYASDQASGLGDFLSVGDTSATSVSGLVMQMQARQATASKFAAETARLSKAGLSKTLLSQLAAAGPGSQLAATLANASPSDIKYLNKAAAAQDKLTKSFGNTMADAMYDSGKDAGKGFLTGLLSQEKALQAEMNKLAEGMVAAIKKKLGIHSPSRVFHDQVGKQIAIGTAQGITAHTPHAVASVQRMADTMAAVRARSTGGSGRGLVVAPRPETHVHVHFDDPRLRDLIRIEVEEGHADLAAAVGVAI
jgi:TP901 family phage tail tape measure protein